MYWFNFNIPEIPGKESDQKLIDILQKDTKGLERISQSRLNWLMSDKGQLSKSKRYWCLDPVKAQCLTARSDAGWNSNYVTRNGKITRLTPIEYERLQTIPDDYTSCISTAQRYKALGNCWTVDVVAHIMKGIK